MSASGKNAAPPQLSRCIREIFLRQQHVKTSMTAVSAEQAHAHCAAKVSFEPIVLKNSVFGKIRENFDRTARPTFRGEGFGQISPLPLTWKLTAPHGKFHLTFLYHGFFPKICDI